MGKQLEILVLDDEEIVCTRLKPALEKDGYIVETFTDSRQAKKRLEMHRFHIVVTDLKMAGIDGMELYEFIKRKWPETRVIMISGFATVDVTRAALQAGVRDIIAKPFKINQLKNLIDEVSAEFESPGGIGNPGK
jgi:DNA-binding NtrC family response regulator